MPKRLFASSTKNGGLPNITGHFIGGAKSSDSDYSGAFQWVANQGAVAGGSWVVLAEATFNASRSNSIYGASSYVLPRNLKVLYCVKF